MKKYVSLYVALAVILVIYKSPIERVDMLTFISAILTLILLINMFKNKKFFNKNIWLAFYLIYVILITLSIILLNNNQIDPILILFRCGKYVLICFLSIFIITNNFFDFRKSSKYVIFISGICTIYIYIQFISYNVLHRLIQNGVAYNLIYQGDYGTTSTTSTINMYRPCSFFLEPGAHALYVIMGIILLLFYNEKNKKNFFIAIFLSIGIIMTGSGLGLVYLFVVWLLWFWKFYLSNLNIKSISGAFVTVLIFFIVIEKLMDTIFVKQIIYRILDGSTLGGNAILARSGGFEECVKMNIIQIIFGNGYGNQTPNVFFSSLSLIIYATGIIGLIFALLVVISAFKKGVTVQKVIAIYIVASIIYGTSFGETSIAFMFPFLLSKNVNKQ